MIKQTQYISINFKLIHYRQLTHLDKAISYKGQIESLAKRLSKGPGIMDFRQRRELLRLLVDEVIYDDAGQVTIKTIIPVNEGQLHPVTGDV